MIRGLQSNTGKPITLTMPMGMQGAKVQQTQSFMPQKTLTIGGKALTVQLAGAGGPKTVTILPAGQSGQMSNSGQQQKKIIVVPQGKFIQQGQQIKTVQVSSASGQIMQVQDVTGQIDPNSIDINDMIEQTDGLNDRRCESLSDDDDDVEETFESKKRHAFIRNQGMFKAKRRIKPRYIRLGLYGGAPTPPREQSSTDPANDSLETIEKMDQITPEEALEALEQSDSAIKDAVEQPSNLTDDSANITLHLSGNDSSDTLHQMSTDDNKPDTTGKLLDTQSHTEDQIKEEDEQKFDSKDAEMMDAQDIESNISASTLYKPKEDDAGGVVVMKQEQPKQEEEKPKITLDQVKTEEQQVSATSVGPSETETEAANILTTIKSGELIANQQQCFDLLSQFETSTQALEQSGVVQKIENDPAKTTDDPAGNFLVTDDDIFKHFTSSGPLDALASAALQASTNQQMQTKTVTTPTQSGANKPPLDKQKQGKGVPKEEVCSALFH